MENPIIAKKAREAIEKARQESPERVAEVEANLSSPPARWCGPSPTLRLYRALVEAGVEMDKLTNE